MSRDQWQQDPELLRLAAGNMRFIIMQVARPDTLPKSAPGSGPVLGNPIGKANTRSKEIQLSSPGAFLAQAGLRTKTVALREKQIAFSQGDAAEAVFYVESGNIRLSVISSAGKEATIALLGAGDFLGEHRQPYSGLKEERWYGCFMSKIHSAIFSSLICLPVKFMCWKTWWISFSIPAKNGWPGPCYSWLDAANMV